MEAFSSLPKVVLLRLAVLPRENLLLVINCDLANQLSYLSEQIHLCPRSIVLPYNMTNIPSVLCIPQI